MSDLFAIATRERYRFESERGQLTTEQLWEVPLRSTKNNFNLDAVAQILAAEIRESEQQSFVESKKNTKGTLAAAKLEIVKAVIAFKLDAEAKAEDRANRAIQRQALLAWRAKKQDEALEGETLEQIDARLAALADDDDADTANAANA